MACAINESLSNQRSKSLQLNVSIAGANYMVMRLLTTARCLESNRLILKKQNICHHFLNKAIGFTYLCTYLEFRCTVSVFSLACFLSIPSSNIYTQLSVRSFKCLNFLVSCNKMSFNTRKQTQRQKELFNVLAEYCVNFINKS